MICQVSEVVTNHNFQFKPQFIASRKAGPASAHPRQANISDPETIKLEYLLSYPEYLNKPELHLDVIRRRYDQPRLESHMFVHLLGSLIAGAQAAAPGLPSAPKATPASFVRMYILCESNAATLMSIAMMLNQILRISNPHDLLLE
ncbi:hypothetical protein MANI_120237 [Metarhizium anisopliae]|nr:hypothetical protein MANI_120237 [Metarhizium anisopliae]